MDEYKSPIEDADFKALFLRLEHLSYEIHKAEQQIKEADNAMETYRLESRYELLLRVFHDMFDDVETFAEQDYLRRNLPVFRKPKNKKQEEQGERQLGWHRRLEDVPKHGLSVQATYGWLEYQYLECESLKRKMRTATPEERLVQESQFAVVVAEYEEYGKRIITNGNQIGRILKGGGILFDF